MKKCPICNEMNEDDRDTCKKCHGSLDFKIYRAEEKDEEKELDIKKKYPSCYHCGYSTPKLRNGLCIICRRKKIALKIVLFFLVALAYGLVNTICQMNGILLGAGPTMLFCALLLFLIKAIPNSIYSNDNDK